jgi:hypothetical protein
MHHSIWQKAREALILHGNHLRDLGLIFLWRLHKQLEWYKSLKLAGPLGRTNLTTFFSKMPNIYSVTAVRIQLHLWEIYLVLMFYTCIYWSCMVLVKLRIFIQSKGLKKLKALWNLELESGVNAIRNNYLYNYIYGQFVYSFFNKWCWR